MWSLLHNPSAYPSAWTHTSSVVGSCFIYKLGMLTGQRFQAELSPSFLWKFTEFRAETPPHAFRIPNCVTPPRLRNSSPRNPPLSLGIPRCCPWYGMDIFWNHPILFLTCLKGKWSFWRNSIKAVIKAAHQKFLGGYLKDSATTCLNGKP